MKRPFQEGIALVRSSNFGRTLPYNSKSGNLIIGAIKSRMASLWATRVRNRQAAKVDSNPFHLSGSHVTNCQITPRLLSRFAPLTSNCRGDGSVREGYAHLDKF